MDLDILRAGFPIVGGPRSVTWHKLPAVRVELDGRKRMTKETKLFAFFHPKTHLPIGISANLGSITQVILYEKLTINPKIDPSMFRFVPPKGWKLVTPQEAGGSRSLRP